MRMFLYYAIHSIKNQIKKLFKTWVAAFFGICVLFGLIIGISVGVLTDSLDDGDFSSSDEAYYSDEYYDDEIPQEILIALIDAGVLLLAGGMTVYSLMWGDKTGGKNFTMADVNLLFSAPLKSQTVLLFKLMTQLGASLLASVYILFQLPNMINSLSMSPLAAAAVVAAWFLMLAFSKLLQMLSYVLSSAYATYKKLITPAVWAAMAAIGVGFYLFVSANGGLTFETALSFFSARGIRFIPIIGWLVGMVHFAVLGNTLWMLCYFTLLLAACVAVVYIIWNIRADFYEETLCRSEENDKILKAAKEGKVMVADKKPHGDRIKREGIGRGWGASVYLYKSLYNRFRFARFKVFTKTAVTYLLTVLLAASVTRFVADSHTVIPVALLLTVLVFYRSLGNPLPTDIEQTSFLMIPESTHKKLFFSLIAGTVDCALDLLPALIAAVAILGASPLSALLWGLFIISVDFYSSAVGTFISLSIPTSTSNIISSIIIILFVYFGLLPIAGLMLAGYLLDMFTLFALLAALFTTVCGAVVYALSPLLINRGRR